MFKPDQLSKDIARSLAENPSEWKSGEYRLTNDAAGIIIWIANELYGMEINGHKPSLASRRHIQTAYKRWLGQKLFAPLKPSRERV